MSSGASFAKLTVAGQARRLRTLAEAALASYAIDWTGLRLITNDWNGVFRVETAAGPLVLRITRPVPGSIDGHHALLLLNSVLVDEDLEVDDVEAFIRRRSLHPTSRGTGTGGVGEGGAVEL